ncbi:hypothetical protein [Neptunicoccus cionae]|uniref:Chalcone isomerase domain-containing protein n=1 Tax=Neptunicoccus cionae TaxID=2035344 RepID=A0A916VLI3_9RHOB|nr:hypothetical protein [Amylibacter cionae]GGA05028.1 hypothetical protein GCM10011498_00510 [Amylibacter cionae]
MKCSFITAIVILIGLVSGLVGAGQAIAQSAPVEVARSLGGASLKGTASARLWGKKLYDAELWTASGGTFDQREPFALTLRYAHAFSADLLARTSVKEIVRVEGGRLSDHGALEQRLRRCLVDVAKGVRVTGVSQGPDRASLFVNGRKTCTLTYPRLRDRFFGIWLAPTSRDARSASRLKGHS